MYTSKNVLFSQKDFWHKGHSLCFLPTLLTRDFVHSKLSAVFFSLLFGIFFIPPFLIKRHKQKHNNEFRGQALSTDFLLKKNQRSGKILSFVDDKITRSR